MSAAVRGAVTTAEITTALRRAAARATYAPSVHNTQPWRFVLQPTALEIYSDLDRHLHVLDPMKRQLLISVGCALFNVRVSLAASMFAPHVERMPDADDPTLAARVRVDHVRQYVVSPLAGYDAGIEQRHTNRSRFSDIDLPEDVVQALVRAVREEDSILLPIRSPEQRAIVARLAQRAERWRERDPGSRAELRAWTATDPKRPDGEEAVASAEAETGSANQCLVLLGTREENPLSWLRAGEALERMWLELTRRGYAASPLPHIVEVDPTRAALRRELGIDWSPHVLVRVGTAPLGPTGRRRRLSDVLAEATGQ
jgi:nitroreductase